MLWYEVRLVQAGLGMEKERLKHQLDAEDF